MLVEQLRSSEDTSRNVIATTKNNYKQGWREQRYKSVLSNAEWITFYIDGLTCVGMREVLKLPTQQNLTSCESNPSVRRQWFQYFAYAYGVEGGGLPASTCFVDLAVRASPELSRTNRVDIASRASEDELCVSAISYVTKKTHEHEYSRVSVPPLKQQERDAFRLQIQQALRAKPADTFTKCWLPDGVIKLLPYSVSAKFGSCAKRAYILTEFPHFHVSDVAFC